MTAPKVLRAPWSAEEAVDLAHRAGFSGTCWTVGPEELVHMLNMVNAQPPTPQAPAPKPDQEAQQAAGSETQADETLWLWKNGDHFLAFRHLYPCFTQGGDPMTLGEPFGRAVLRHSHNREGRDEHANDLHAGNAAQGCQLWPAGRALGSSEAAGVPRAGAAQAPAMRVDGVHGALGRSSLDGAVEPQAPAVAVRSPIEGERFVRAWLQLDKLPGAMMESTDGRFGPIGAFTSCAITTSETFRDEWKRRGMPFIEVWASPSPAASAEGKKSGAPSVRSRDEG